MCAAGRDVVLSIVIVSWNTRELLTRCIESLVAWPPDALRLTQPGDAAQSSIEVLVVDNASDDGSADLVRERFPWVRLIQNAANVGFAVACNQAIRATGGQYLLLLNPDAAVEPCALTQLVRFMEEHPEAGAAAPMLVDAGGESQLSCSPAPTLRRELWRLFHLDAIWPYAVYRMCTWPTDRARGVDVAQGACLILRRTALSRVGLLDEQFFIYSEEVDLCQRLRSQGWQIFWVPQARVLHHGGQSTRQVAAAMFLRLYQGKILYFRKHGGAPAARRYKLILSAAALGRLLISPLTWLEPPSRRERHQILASYYEQLLRALPGM
jgi:N-acetylglucosaminyl-diphospho-decaprenol L-rhamnosyltransferase